MENQNSQHITTVTTTPLPLISLASQSNTTLITNSERSTIQTINCLRKPVILFYNYQYNEEINTTIKLKQDIWRFSHVLPKPSNILTLDYEYSWKFIFKGEFNLYNETTTKTSPYIFWESSLNTDSTLFSDLLKENYFCFTKDESLDKIDTILKLKGLNTTERNDLITYWIQDITSKNFVIISFLQENIYNELADLEVAPKPDQLIRVIMLIKPCDEFVENGMKMEDVEPVLRCDERLVVEWGGCC